jgi:isopenicillin-N N-acyltransferase like protein
MKNRILYACFAGSQRLTMPTSDSGQGHSLQVIKLTGDAHRRGVQHGRAAGDLIRRYPDILLRALDSEARLRALDSSRTQLTREALLEAAMRFLPRYESFAPELVEELRGIAEGARLSLAEVLLCNVRAEVAGLARSEALCTAFALGRSATASRSVLAGQNLDQDPINGELLVVLHVEPDEGPAQLMCSFAGLIGYPGINEHGLAVFQNALSTREWRGEGMPHYLFKRVLLSQPAAQACIDLASTASMCSAANYVIADRSGTLLDLEVTPAGTAVLKSDDDVLVHANHFEAPDFVSQDALLSVLPDSPSRTRRAAHLLRSARGRLDLELACDALKDHDGAPRSICRHEENTRTIASIVAEPDAGRLHVAAGPPCSTLFETYSL